MLISPSPVKEMLTRKAPSSKYFPAYAALSTALITKSVESQSKYNGCPGVYILAQNPVDWQVGLDVNIIIIIIDFSPPWLWLWLKFASTWRFRWECVKSIGLFVLGVVLARWGRRQQRTKQSDSDISETCRAWAWSASEGRRRHNALYNVNKLSEAFLTGDGHVLLVGRELYSSYRHD